jgi:hypothetical protein
LTVGRGSRHLIDPEKRHGPIAVATVTTALVTWPIAFNLGAYRAVFYEDIFKFVVAATVGFVIALVWSPYRGRDLFIRCAALAAPAVWLFLSVLWFDSTAAAASDPVFGVIGLLAALVSIPTVLKMLVDLFVPQLGAENDLRAVGFAVATIVVAIAGFAVGNNNERFLTCDDFKVAGADQPPKLRSALSRQDRGCRTICVLRNSAIVRPVASLVTSTSQTCV